MTGGSWSISLCVAAMAVVSFVCVFLLSEAYLRDLSAIRPEERRLIAEQSAAGQDPRVALDRSHPRSVQAPPETTASGLTGEPVAPTSLRGVQIKSKL